MRIRAACLALLPLSLLIGCAADEDPAPGDSGPDPVSGRYQVTSTYDLSQSDAVPDVIGNALEPLSGLSEDPAGTLIAVLQASGSPALNDLLDAIPSSLLDAFEGAVNDFVFDQIDKGGTAADIILWTDDIAGILTHFEVISNLDLGRPDETGAARADHTLAAVSFEMRGETQLVDTPDIINTLTVARDVDCTIESSGEGEAITIANHAFHLPLGDFAVVGFNQALQSSLGVPDLHAALGLAIDCPALAQKVASICLGPVCVGHEAEIEGFCDDGLEAVASEVEARIASIDFAELRMSSGQAVLLDAAKADAPTDGRIDAMDGGHWASDFEIDGLVIPVDASFRAVRADL